jgi:hypothetical protein
MNFSGTLIGIWSWVVENKHCMNVSTADSDARPNRAILTVRTEHYYRRPDRADSASIQVSILNLILGLILAENCSRVRGNDRESTRTGGATPNHSESRSILTPESTSESTPESAPESEF